MYAWLHFDIPMNIASYSKVQSSVLLSIFCPYIVRLKDTGIKCKCLTYYKYISLVEIKSTYKLNNRQTPTGVFTQWKFHIQTDCKFRMFRIGRQVVHIFWKKCPIFLYCIFYSLVNMLDCFPCLADLRIGEGMKHLHIYNVLQIQKAWGSLDIGQQPISHYLITLSESLTFCRTLHCINKLKKLYGKYFNWLCFLCYLLKLFQRAYNFFNDHK